MSGDLEMEIEKILNNSNRLYNYINENLYLTDIVNQSMERIGNIKKAQTLIKSKFIVNSSKTIQTGVRKQNLHKTYSLLKDIEVLKGISTALKTNTGDFYELIEQGKAIMNRYTNCNLKIFHQFEEEYDQHINKGFDILYENLAKDLKDVIYNIITFGEVNDYLAIGAYVRLYLIIVKVELYNFEFTKLKSNEEVILNILSQITYEELNLSILSETIPAIIKIDENFYLNISSITKGLFYDVLASLKNQINNIIYNNLDDER
jgi:hypothetical protein